MKKAVVVAAPHTSNWDLVFTLALAAVLDVKISWVGKHSLFRPPMGTLMRWIGGVPVNRRGHHNAVDAIVELLNQHEELLLIIAPEGTRGRARRWKTGFYRIAQGAKVPIVLGFVDYGNKIGGLGAVFEPTGNLRKDFETIHDFYANMKGKYRDQQGEISLGELHEDPEESSSAEGQVAASRVLSS